MAGIRFTQEEMKTLKKYEDNLERAYRSQYCRNMLTRDVNTIDDILRNHNVNLNVNPSCGTCILEMLTYAGRIYFEQKAEQAQKAKAAKKAKAKKEEK